MLIYDQNLGAKTVAASSTVTFTASDVPSGAAFYSFYMTGAGNNLSNVTRLRAKAGGQTIWDITPAQLRAFMARMSESWAVLGASATRWSLLGHFPEIDREPLHMPGERDQARGMSGFDSAFPVGPAPTFEIVTNGSAGAGNAFASWAHASEKPTFYHKFLGSQMNIAASQTNARYPITQDGLLRAFVVPTTGLNRFKLVLNGTAVINIDGTAILELQAMEMDQGQALTDPICWRLAEPLPIVSGNSYVEIDSAGGWAGVTNELGLYTVLPQ